MRQNIVWNVGVNFELPNIKPFKSGGGDFKLE